MKWTVFGFIMTCLLTTSVAAGALDTKAGEKAIFAEMKKLIPADRVKTVDELYRKWQEIQGGKSKAVIVDLRTEAEFDSGHIRDTSNIDSGHAYTIPARWAGPETESMTS